MNFPNLDNISFSIILCCYNSEKYIEETLYSILNQTYNNYEIIIVDDGSKDSTPKIIRNFIISNDQIKIKYFYNNNSGLSSSRNFAISKAQFDWIAIIDHDDMWLKTKLEEQAKNILNNPSKKLFFSDYYILKNKKKFSRFKIYEAKDNFVVSKLNLTKYSGFINLIIYGCFIGSSTVVFDKKIIKHVGYFDINYKFLCDYIFFIEVAKKYNIHCNNSILSIWRSHESQFTNKLYKLYFLEMFKLFNKVIFYENINILNKLIVFKKYIKLYLSFTIKKIIRK